MIALDLAEAGHTGPRNILDSATHYRFASDLRLGLNLHIRNSYFKLYACCRHVHAPLDALIDLMVRNDLQASEISSIVVRTYGGALRISNKVSPTNLVDIQYSIPYCLALAAMVGPRSLLPLTEQALRKPGLTEFASRVTLMIDPNLDARFPAETLAQLEVVCGSKTVVSEILAPRGEASNPLSRSELEGKLRDATRLNATLDQQDRILDSVRGLEDGNLQPLKQSLADLVLSKSDTKHL